MKLKATVAICVSLAAPVTAEEVQDLAQEGGQVIVQLAGALQAELQSAMQAGGPVAAVDLCNIEAQSITYDISDANEGWEISRSSHRLRNPANAPDAYTAAAIDDFLNRLDAGEDPQTLVRAEIIEQDDQRVFRMTRAIPTAGVCLTCHGASEVSAEVADILADRYPEDMARGFSEGDMRGVFVLSKVLDAG
ncbi:DUF3365 domain-containing protein [Yoonia sp. BS5-3]|uniref:DUF3365 domain-containing protein n=1 Tax=Yoonia phaeophyticola TaxID=3137369 RepID=A0ABZ2V172_9RHOB